MTRCEIELLVGSGKSIEVENFIKGLLATISRLEDNNEAMALIIRNRNEELEELREELREESW